MEPKKVLKWIVFTLVAANLALLAYVLLGMASPKPEPMPNPNGYDDLVKALPLLHGTPVNYQAMKREELKDLADDNKQTMVLLEAGISKQCHVLTNYISSSNYGSVVLPPLASFKQAGSLFCAQGRLAELEGRTNDAIQFYLEGIRFGQDIGQGGVMIEKLVSVACQAIAMKPLENLCTNLDAKQCAHIARELEAIDAQEETDEKVLKHENDFSRNYGGIRGQFTRLIMFKSLQESQKKCFIKIHTAQLRRRGLMIAFASRAYYLERGKPAPNTDALVPDYLRQIPKATTIDTNLTSFQGLRQ